MSEVFLCDGVRTPFGRYGGALSGIRADDLAALPLTALQARNPQVDWAAVDEVIFGCANQAGEDNRNVARMALLLAGLPPSVPGVTVNRLCASGLEAIANGARLIRSGEADLVLAGGVESMSRAPFVMAKAETPFSRQMALEDTTIGWRFINPKLHAGYGTESMPETAENLAAEFGISRADQDAYALRSQQRAAAAQAAGLLAQDIIPVEVPARKGAGQAAATVVTVDEQPRPETSLDSLARLPTPFRAGGTVTAGNASGVNDGAGAVILASPAAVKRHGLTPRARILGSASAGVPPRIMGIGPVPALTRLLQRHDLTLNALVSLELNEAFAAQVLACLRQLGLPDDTPQVNPLGGAIALGHPLGASGVRLALAAIGQMNRTQGQYAAASLCVGVGQGLATLFAAV